MEPSISKDDTPTRDDLLAIITASHQDFDAALAGLDDATLDETGVVEGWSILDMIGHVTAWEQLVVQYLEHWRRGEPPSSEDLATDDYNAREVARRRGWTPARVREEAAATRQRLHTLMEEITDEEWSTPVIMRGRERTLGAWIGGALNGDRPGTHASEHARQIVAWRAGDSG